MTDKNHADTQWDAIVIGAGLGGMTSAACLAAAGKKTLLLERYAVMGGCSHVFRRNKQWEFDVGVHYMGLCGPGGALPALMKGLALDDRIEWLPLDPTGFDTIRGPDLELKVPAGWDPYLESLIRTFPKDEKKLRFYIKVMRRLGESLDRESVMAGQGSTLSRMTSTMKRAGWAAPFFMMPHAAFLASCGFDPKTLLALSVQDGALASTPLELPVGMAAALLQDFVGGGAWYPRGGGQMFSAGFAEVVESHGGAIRTNAEVERILVSGGAVQGLQMKGGEKLLAPIVVSAGDIKKTYEDLVGFENLSAAMVKKVQKMKMSTPLINAFFCVEQDLRQSDNSNYFIIPSWDDASSLMSLQRMSKRLLKPSGRTPVEWAMDYAANQPGYVQCSTRRDPANLRSAPLGHGAVEVQSLAPYDLELWGISGMDIASGEYRESKQYQQVKEIILEGFSHRMEKAYPGSSTRVVDAELGSPAAQERFTFSSGGAAFGLRADWRQSGPFRPGTKTEIKGLLLAGASTYWGPGTVGSTLSGVHAASVATGRDLLHEMQSGSVIADKTRMSCWGSDFDPLLASRGTAARLKQENKRNRKKRAEEKNKGGAE
ncbi:NAD(P)/FAD-dependent oxidoreductase [Alcanivorax sp.]|jgi:phytoene dehydrogenase-like protein|uniref:phytoene desaturase family protein n=1 Tax=Alcanivorax sp. TaxID=1872427 RepID=UPI0032D8D0BA